MVPETGIEPVRSKARDFKSLVSTYSTTRVLASLAGFEPAAYGLEGRYSIQLSYSEIIGTP